jgi:hypothetical protein
LKARYHYFIDSVKDNHMANYDYWNAKIAGKEATAFIDQPELGWYRMRQEKNGVPVPVHIFEEFDGTIVAQVGTSLLIDHRAAETWNRCCDQPITRAEYERVAKDGLPWSDIDASLMDRPGIGHNQPVELTPLETFKDQIASALAGVDEYKTIASDEQAARAQTKRARLLELSKNADEQRKKEKAPWLATAQQIDGRWLPTINSASEAATAIRLAMQAWEDSKRAAAPKEYAPAPIKGAVGRAASVKVVPVVEIVDQLKVYKHFAGHEAVVRVLIDLAQDAFDHGTKVPGIKIQQKAQVR